MRSWNSNSECLDWRWQRVLRLASGDCLFDSSDDQLVEVASRTLVSSGCSASSDDPISTAVTLAHELEHSQLRAVVEARILARQSLHTVSERTGIPREAVAWFVVLFFDVIDYLTHPDAVYQFAIASGINEPAPQDVWSRTMKLVGYCCGGDVLDRLTLVPCATGSVTLSQLRDALGEQSSAVVAQGLWDLAHGIAGADATSQTQLLRTLVREQESMSDADGSSSDIMQNIAVMLQSLPLEIGEYNTSTTDSISPTLPNGAELTSNEFLRTGLGLPVDGLEQASQAEYPAEADDAEYDIQGGQS